ncbi:hypothetical protein [Streptomyces scabiei]|uniref:hypothetical protein n=1 Tax=Streptomyces scabiei TaxID=1930 RepID=UPI0029B5F769|nr:hypothetical protein [Streptomyces scabiei]MDX3206032.1 hypothetical protein [Streptomyces scabiei]
MNDRTKLIETLRQARRDMDTHRDAYTAYLDARDAANAAFCDFANRYGWAAALESQKEAE